MDSNAAGFQATITVNVDDLESTAIEFRAAMADHFVVSLKPDRNLDDVHRFYDQLVEAVGMPIDIGEEFSNNGAPNGHRWSEICYDPAIPDMAAFRHSKNAQPLHTDESYVSALVGIMFFYCVNAADTGGETVFVDGLNVVEQLSQDDPGLLEQLTTVDVTYAKASDSKTRPIIEFDERGLPNLNFNYFCVAPNQPDSAIQLNQRFHDFLEHDLSKESIFAISLQPGDAAAWKDQHVLHGRNAFAASKTNERWIRKTGVSILELTR